MHERKNNLLNIVRDEERVDFVLELECISQLDFLECKQGTFPYVKMILS